MGQSTPLSLRHSVIKLRSDGLSFIAISEQTGVPYGTVERLCSCHGLALADSTLTPNVNVQYEIFSNKDNRSLGQYNAQNNLIYE